MRRRETRTTTGEILFGAVDLRAPGGTQLEIAHSYHLILDYDSM